MPVVTRLSRRRRWRYSRVSPISVARVHSLAGFLECSRRWLSSASFAGLLALSAALWALFLVVGLRWAKIPTITRGRVLAATVLVIVADAVMRVPLILAASRYEGSRESLQVVGLLLAVLVPCVVISLLFKASLLRSFQAWLPTLLGSVALLLFTFFVVVPHLCEAFVISANSMAPTLLGYHARGECRTCREIGFATPTDAEAVRFEPAPLICRQFHVTWVNEIAPAVHQPDRILVAKFRTPKRWDIVSFRYPEDPSVVYVKRLIGLPGERVQIDDGTVWINGARLDPPDDLRELRYVAEWAGKRFWGAKDQPAMLEADEYFVLGDFSERSKDSRSWSRAAPGHNPFAVPASHLEGVVTHIYWPPNRWRRFVD